MIKFVFRTSFMAAILKNGSHLEFEVASVTYGHSDPQGVFVPNLVLVSGNEVLLQLSAALIKINIYKVRL